MKMIKKQFQVGWKDGMLDLAVILVSWLAGILIGTLLWKEGEEAFLGGTVLGAVLGILIGQIRIMLGMKAAFNLEVSMGCSRSKFFYTYYIVTCILNLVSWLFFAMLALIEKAGAKILYPGMNIGEWEMAWRGILLVYLFSAILLPAIGMFMGALVLRFGSKMQLLLWMLWMIGSLSLQRIPHEAWDACAAFVNRCGLDIAGWALAACGAVTGVVCAAAAWALLRKQQVTL